MPAALLYQHLARRIGMLPATGPPECCSGYDRSPLKAADLAQQSTSASAAYISVRIGSQKRARPTLLRNQDPRRHRIPADITTSTNTAGLSKAWLNT